MAHLIYVDKDWLLPLGVIRMVTFEKGESTIERIFKDELRIDDQSSGKTLIRIEIGMYDKWKLLSLLLADLISNPDGYECSNDYLKGWNNVPDS